MSSGKDIEHIIKDVFGNRCEVTLHGDACYIEFLHEGNSACIAIGLIAYPDVIKIQEGCSVMKKFDEVESVLLPVLSKHDINIGFWKSTIFKDFNIGQHEFNKHDLRAVEAIFNEIKSLSYIQGTQFLNLFKKLDQVYEASERMEVKEMVNFISQPLPLRRMVIKKLCEDNGFDDFCNKYIESAKQKARSSQFKGYDLAAQELYNTLRLMSKSQ